MGDTPALQSANNGIPGAVQSPVPGATSIDDSGTVKNIKGQTVGQVDPAAGPNPNPQQATKDFWSQFTPAQEQIKQEAQQKTDFWSQFTPAAEQPGKQADSSQEPEDTRDPVTKTAAAFNEMLTGSENLTDLYDKASKFVHESPEASRAGQLAGYSKLDSFVVSLAKGAWQAQQNEAKIAKQYWNQSDKSADAGSRVGWSAAGGLRGVQAGIPLIGPILGMIEDNVSNGHYAKAVGQAMAALLPGMAEEHGMAVIDRMTPQAQKAAAESVNRLVVAQKTRLNSEAVYNARTKEVEVARKQAESAHADAQIASAQHQVGQVDAPTLDAANNRASAATANANKAQQALTDAAEQRANANFTYDNQQRITTRQLSGADKSAKDVADATAKFKKAFSDANHPLTDEQVEIAMAHVADDHATAALKNPAQMTEALDNAEDRIDQTVKNASAPHVDQPIANNPLEDVVKSLSPANKLESGWLDKGLESLSDFNLKDLTIGEAQQLITRLNTQMRGLRKSKFWDFQTAVSNSPEFAAKSALVDSLRTGVSDALEDLGVEDTQQARREQAAVISVRDAVEHKMERGDQVVRGTSDVSNARKFLGKNAEKAGKLGGGALGGGAGLLLGHFPGAWAGERLGELAGGWAGKQIGERINPGDWTRNDILQNSADLGRAAQRKLANVTEAPPRPLPVDDVPPQVGAQLSHDELRQLLREQTPLHSMLASYFKKSTLDTSYRDLQSDFDQLVASKQAHGVQLTPQEDKIIAAVNDQNLVDHETIRNAYTKASEQAEAEPQPKTATLPKNAEPLVRPEASRFRYGLGMREAMTHDLAHAYVAHKLLGDKIIQKGIRSHLHPDQVSGGLMSVGWDWRNFADEDGKFDADKFHDSIDDIAATYMAGGVANDLYHGVPFDSNQHLGADMRNLDELMNTLGIDKKKQAEIKMNAALRAREILSKPGVEQILHDHASVREPNLPEFMHFSPKRLEQVFADLEGGEPNEPKGNESGPSAKGSNSTAKENTAELRGSGVPGEAEGSAEGQLAKGKRPEREGPGGPANKAKSNTPVHEPASAKFDETAEDDVTHRETEKGGEVRLDRGGKNRGMVKYTKTGDGEYAITAARLDKEFQGKGLGKKMYEQAAEQARSRGAKSITSDLGGTDSFDSARVWDSLSKDHPGEIEKFENKPGSPGYRWNLQPEEVTAPGNPKFDEAKFKTGLKETTTGDPARDEAIKKGGGIPADQFGGLSMFHDPQTGSTLALQHEEVSPARVQKHIADSRAAFTEGKLRNEARAAAEKNGVEHVRQGADAYNESQGLKDIDPLTHPLNEKTSRAVADAYDQMQHRPNDPAVRASYEALKNDINKQWDYATQKMGMNFEPWTKEGQPYASSKDMVADVKNNKHLYYFKGGEAPPGNPLREVDPATGLTPNDKFRAVHDLFGHAANGNQFGPKGEEVAYQTHRQMFSPEAIPALTTETRGQNSWVNYGKHLRDEAGNIPAKGGPGYVPATERPYAEQKVDLLPEQFHAANPSEVEPAQQAAPAAAAPEAKAPSLEQQIQGKFGANGEPGDSSWIGSNGKRTPLGSATHEEMVKQLQPDVDDPRMHGINSGMVRERYRTTRGGPEVVFSVSPDGVTPEQVNAMKAGAAKVGRYGSVVIERSDISPETKNDYAYHSEFGGGKAVDEGLDHIFQRSKPEITAPGNPKFDSDRVSTRVPEGKNAKENPLEGDPLSIGREAIEASPQKLQDSFATKAREVAGVKVPKNITDNGKVYDRFVRHVADNLKWLYNQVPKEQQIANAKWYESANKMADNYGKQYNVTQQQAAGVIAALSPQTEWDTNVSLAKRAMDTYTNHLDKPVTEEMIQKGDDIIKNSRKNPKAKKANAALAKALPELLGKKMSDLTGVQRAMAVRLFDEVTNSREFHRIDPATGNEMEVRTTATGEPANAGWGNFNNLAKALSILDDGSRENISNMVGKSHKVRNFYNNIIDPTNAHDVTIDTHAVGAGTLLPVSGNSPEVTNNFGAGGAKGTGVKGMYGLYADAYRMAAEELGLKARELQSVTWEKVRDLFPAEWKTKANMERVKAEWSKYTDGKQSIDDTRNNILQLSTDAKAEVEAKIAAKKVKAEAKAAKAAVRASNGVDAGADALAGKRMNGLDFLNALRENRGQGNLFGGQ